MASSSSKSYCKICLKVAPKNNKFKINECSHVFCRTCLSQYIAAKVGENISTVKCPEVGCKEVLEPVACLKIVPKQVLEKWEVAVCESKFVGSKKFYCPFKDCSAVMVDDGEETVTQAECPVCNRLFCAQCRVAWHADVTCKQFMRLGADERGREDRQLVEIAERKKWKRCPKCKFFVEKTSGCQHITCRCRFEFCYGCSREWGTKCNGCSGGS